MDQDSVIKHMTHYCRPTSMRLAAEFCRHEVEQIRELMEGALAEVPVSMVYDLGVLNTVESHWTLLKIGIETLEDTDYVTVAECVTQLDFLHALIQQYGA